MALNALQADMVRFTGTPGIEVNGITVGYKAEYTPRTSTDPKYDRLIDNKHSSNIDYSGQYYVQLGEELYNGELTKKHVTDDFERPSYNWQFKGKEIGTYVDYTVLVNGGTYTEAVKFSELYDLLTYTSINENDISRFEDGVQLAVNKSQFARSNKDEVGGQGVLTEVFLDRDRKQITITSINTYLAQANSDYNTTNETLSLKVYQSSSTGSTKIVDSKDVPQAANVAKDDYKLVYMSGKENATSLTDYARFDVVKMFDVDIMAESSVTKWTKVGATSLKVVDKLTTGGTEYKSNPKAFYDKGNVFDDYNEQLLTDTSYNIYMDRYGNVIGVDLFEGTRNYVFITGYDRGISHISIKTADAAAIFMDGTMDTITVNVTDTDKNIENAQKGSTAYNEYNKWTRDPDGDVDHNRWYTYTQASNGIYTLKPVKNFAFTSYTGLTDANPKTLNSANLFLDDSGVTNKGRFYGNDNSVYLTVTPGRVDKSNPEPAKDAITDVEGVYTGAQDVKLDLKPSAKQQVNTNTLGTPKSAAEKDAYVYSIFNSDYYIIASIVMGEAQGATTNYIYTLGGAKSERVEHGSDSRAASDDTYYWEVDAVVNGEKTTLTVKSKFHETVDVIEANKFMLVKVRYDGEYVTKIEPVNAKDVFTNQFSMAKIDDMKVYDVGNEAGGVNWVSDEVGYVHNVAAGLINPDLGTYVDNHNGKRIDGVIQLVGRTLYTDRANGDVGLALASDAKAVLVQPENGKIESVSCGSVAEAVGRLADENPNTADKEFEGRVVAVLDGNGVAKWVVIISDTNLRTGNNPNYGWNSSVDFGNIRIVVYNMGTKGVSGYIGGDNALYITLPRVETLSRAAADTDKYEVSVNINGAYVGNATWYADTATTVTYRFNNVSLNTTNMNILVTVIPESSGTITPPDPGATKVTDIAITGIPTEFEEGKVPTGSQAVTLTTIPANGATASIVWGTAKDGKVTGTITVAAASSKFDISGAKVTVNGKAVTMTGNKITVEATVKSGDTPVVPTDLMEYKAKNNSGTYEFYSYKQRALTDDEVKTALLAATKGTAIEFNPDIASGKALVTVDGAKKEVTFKTGTVAGSGSQTATKELVKVSYKGTAIAYVETGVTSTGETSLTQGLKVVEAEAAGNNSAYSTAITVGAKGVATIDTTTTKTDVNLVPAVTITLDSSVNGSIEVDKGNSEGYASGSNLVVAEGSNVRFTTASNATAGVSYALYVNGVKVGDAKVGPETAGTLKFVAAIKGDENQAAAVAIKPEFEVYLNGTKVTPAASGIILTDLKANSKVVAVAKDASGKIKVWDATGITLAASPVDATKGYIAANQLTTALVVDGKIDLWSATDVTLVSGETATVTFDSVSGTKLDISGGTTYVVPQGAKIVVTGAANGKSLNIATTGVTDPVVVVNNSAFAKAKSGEITIADKAITVTEIDTVREITLKDGAATDATFVKDKAAASVVLNNTTDLAALTAENFTVMNADGTAKVTGNLEASTTYTVIVKGVKAASGKALATNLTSANVSFAKSTGDAYTVAGDSTVKLESDGTYTVTFIVTIDV